MEVKTIMSWGFVKVTVSSYAFDISWAVWAMRVTLVQSRGTRG